MGNMFDASIAGLAGLTAPPAAVPGALTVTDVASILRCDEETAAERVIKGDLPGVKFGRSWIIPAAAFFQRLNELALEEAEARRAERAKELQDAAAKAAKAAAAPLSVAMPSPSQRGRVRRTPPPLPTI